MVDTVQPGKFAWTSLEVQPLRVRVALSLCVPFVEGGRGPEVLPSLLPMQPIEHYQ